MYGWSGDFVFPIISTGYNLLPKEPSPSIKRIGPFTISMFDESLVTTKGKVT